MLHLALFLLFMSGSQASGKIRLNLLLVGKTGVGKTSIVNTVYNVIKEVSSQEEKQLVAALLHHNRVFDATVSGVSGDVNLLKEVGQSQTQKITKYEFSGDQYHLNIYDTPGILSTRGKNADFEALSGIQSLMTKVAFDGILVVQKSLEASRRGLEFKVWTQALFQRLPLAVNQYVYPIYTYPDILDYEDTDNLTDHFQSITGVRKAAFLINNLPLFSQENDTPGMEIAWEENVVNVREMLHTISQNSPSAIEGESLKVKAGNLLKFYEAMNEVDRGFEFFVKGRRERRWPDWDVWCLCCYFQTGHSPGRDYLVNWRKILSAQEKMKNLYEKTIIPLSDWDFYALASLKKMEVAKPGRHSASEKKQTMMDLDAEISDIRTMLKEYNL